MEEEVRNNIYEVINDLAIRFFKYLVHLFIVFIRMTVYWLVKLIYKIFKLSEIDVARERAKFLSQDSLTTIKHEFVFDKSDEFVAQWIYFKNLIIDLDLDEDDKEELIENVMALMSETERTAFNVVYNYLLTKDLREPSFEDMIIQGIFKNNGDIEPREKLDNPYSQSNLQKLRNERHDKKNENYSEKKARGIY